MHNALLYFFLAALCQPANGYKIEIKLQRAYDNSTTCEKIDATSGFMNEAVGLLYIEHGVVPESCVILPPKIFTYCCKEKDEKSLKQVEITVNTLVICDPCEPLSQETKRKEKTKTKTQKRKKGGIIINDALPEELFVNSVAFDVRKVKEKGKRQFFCGYTSIGRQKLMQCSEYTKLFIIIYFTSYRLSNPMFSLTSYKESLYLHQSMAIFQTI